MNKVTVIMDGKEIANFETAILPREGEVFFLNANTIGSIMLKVDRILYDIDTKRRRMNVAIFAI